MEEETVRLFIADISGYTKFLISTDLVHAKFIINELLEGLNKKALKGMVLNQVEGDALFYYSKKVSKEDLEKHTDILNNEFHKIIENLTRDHRNCKHKICKKLDQLHLKFLIHEGEILFQEIGKTEQIIGRSIIEIHRLLKNSVNLKSYVLVVDNNGKYKDTYEHLGEIRYRVINKEQ